MRKTRLEVTRKDKKFFETADYADVSDKATLPNRRKGRQQRLLNH
jgi:hypothetical protein